MSAATPEQIEFYAASPLENAKRTLKAEAVSVTQADGSVRYYRPITADDLFAGMRLTDCCAAVSTYMDDGYGGQELTCKACYHTVDNGQGDGDEALNADGTVTLWPDRSVTISLADLDTADAHS